MSDRYHCVIALLDDVDNLLCVLREIRRRFGTWPDAINLFAGPWRVSNGKTVLTRLPGSNSTPFLLAELSQTAEGWYVLINTGDNKAETGPFDTEAEARTEAEHYILDMGEVETILTEFPWDSEDVIGYPIT